MPAFYLQFEVFLASEVLALEVVLFELDPLEFDFALLLELFLAFFFINN